MTSVNDAELLNEMQGYINQASVARDMSESKSQVLERVGRFLGVPAGRISNYYYNKVKAVRAIDIENARRKIALTEANTKRIKAEIERLRGLNAKLDSSIHVGNTQLDCKKEYAISDWWLSKWRFR